MYLEDVTTSSIAATDRVFMETALSLARQASVSDEVPVGAVIVLGARIVGRGHNRPIAWMDPTAHAEIVALREAARSVGNYRLSGATAFVTVEPCLMCAGALLQARIKRVVYGCADPKSGALGSAYDVGRDRRANHQFEVTGGVCETDAKFLLQGFFRARRGA